MSIGLNYIQASRRLLVRAYEEIQAEHGVSLSDTVVLLSVGSRPGLTLRELSESLSRDKTTVSRSVSSLLEKGLVRTELDSRDGRRKNLFLTEKGQHVILPALDSIEDDIEAAAVALDVPDLDVLGKVSAFLKSL